MGDDRVVSVGTQAAGGDRLTEFLRDRARSMLQAAIEAECDELLSRYAEVRDLKGQRAVVRNGHLPERSVVTGLGEVSVKVPRVRDRPGSGIRAAEGSAAAHAGA